MFNKLIHKLFLTCKEATLLLELKDDNQINYMLQKRLDSHLLICDDCKTYNAKRDFINKILANYSNPNSRIKTDEVKIARLKEKINSYLNK